MLKLKALFYQTAELPRFYYEQTDEQSLGALLCVVTPFSKDFGHSSNKKGVLDYYQEPGIVIQPLKLQLMKNNEATKIHYCATTHLISN